MTLFDAILLGLVQGFTEFLPVSSSGHLVMTQEVLGIRMPGILLEVALHVATLFSVVIVYRARLWQILRGALRREAAAWHYIAALAIATIPAVFVGLFLKDAVETAFDTPFVTAIGLLITAALLVSTRFATRRAPVSELDRVREHERAAELRREGPVTVAGPAAPPYGISLVLGIAQAFAILPGVSRSGSTITAGLWSRLSGERAAEFSFLMSIPAILGATILMLADVDQASSGLDAVTLAAGFLAALVSGVVAIKSLVWLLRRQAFHHFAWYVAFVALAFLAYLALV
ncbi:MAG TPA: undecaprenyl-diphosphate phosphatase [Longimicrobiales bacterium]|nr:undecaprenyl-diphosphate phosphatase [Longimicrobiales bacterium]